MKYVFLVGLLFISGCASSRGVQIRAERTNKDLVCSGQIERDQSFRIYINLDNEWWEIGRFCVKPK